MKASKMISQLQAMVALHGDLDVKIPDGSIHQLKKVAVCRTPFGSYAPKYHIIARAMVPKAKDNPTHDDR